LKFYKVTASFLTCLSTVNRTNNQETETSLSGSSEIDEEISENDLESFCEVETDINLTHDEKKINSEIV
jgi:hypothetical protein